MMAITVQQPWAWAIIHADPPKNIENRTRIGTWRRAVGERICIHAGRRWSERGADSDLLQRAYAQWLGFPHWDGPYGGRTAMPIDLTDPRDAELLDLGAIIGTVVVEDVHEEHGGCCAPWGEQSYTEHGGTKRVDIVHLMLTEPRALTEPLPIGGALGLWSVGPWREVIAREAVSAS